MPDTYVGAIDQATTGTRFAPFDRACETRVQVYPGPGRVGHDPVGTRENTRALSRALRTADVNAARPAGPGATSRHETGEPAHDALLRQDRRTTDHVGVFEGGGERATDRATEGDT